MKRFIAAISGLLLLSLPMQAQVFSVTLQGGNKLYFSVTDSTARRVEIIQPGAMIGTQLALPTGGLEIPASVSFKGVSYQVSSIRERAFAEAEGLTSVSIPSTVREIGAQAFSGCTHLEGVVFPAIEPTISRAAFEGCKSLRSLSFGSDWRSVDLGHFAQSEVLTSVFIPARVVKISNIKLLNSLERVDVDKNNPAFSSQDGILFSRDGKALYACPNARTGQLGVPVGVERIQEGAFNGCAGLTEITFPSTVHEFSYLEFAECSALTELTILSEIPPVTAKWNGSPVFAIRKPGDGLKVRVPSSSLNRYQTAVCDSAGDYENMAGRQQGSLAKEELLGRKDIMRSKSSR